MHPDDLEVSEILLVLQDRQRAGHPRYYAPLDPARSTIIRAHYRSQLRLPESGSSLALFNVDGTQLCRGYARIVVGDYGAFVECEPPQICRENLRQRYGSAGVGTYSSGARKYQWLVTNDSIQTKVYEQLGTVKYADYRVGMYYFAPDDVRQLVTEDAQQIRS